MPFISRFESLGFSGMTHKGSMEAPNIMRVFGVFKSEDLLANTQTRSWGRLDADLLFRS